MQSVCFRHRPILIKQKGASDGALFEKFSRLPHAIPFFCSDEYQLRSVVLDLFDSLLNLSHALDAVWSPRAAQEFKDERALRQQGRQRESSRTIRRLQRKIGSLGSNFERIRSIFHLRFTLGQSDFITQERLKSRECQLSWFLSDIISLRSKAV